MKSKIKMIFKRFFIVISIIFIGIIIYKYIDRNQNENLATYTEKSINSNENDDTENINDFKEEIMKNEDNEEERVESIEIMAVGDLLMHIDIVQAMYDWNNDTYNFDYNFELIKEYLEKADLTIANLETTLAGKESGFSGYPCFNTPDELADSIKKAGVDILSNISNHSLDKGDYGFLRTRKVLKEKGFDVIGTRDTEDESRYIIKDIKGIKVGIIAYSYTTDGYEGGRGLNGIPIPEELNPLMNTFNHYDLDNDFLLMKEQIEKMKKEEVDAIVFYMHWGEEYQLEPNESQIKIANFLVNEGVDIIFGDHPHTIQPIDIIESKDGNHSTAVIYSLGNFISSQRTESIGNPYTEDGLMVSVNITKNFKSGEVIVGIPKYMPTWVKLNVINGNYYYQVVPTIENDTDYLDYYQSIRVDESFDRTFGIVESYNDSVEVWNEN
ncbi:Bacterial capsule synthesis protein PGA_cap [uncultured Clostridium sp.]|uniref:CapA family protein n=1 Tax=uncultured Clostridium sp. TaxID=59620 RepID=UPI000822FB5A|nr:CapA family protein [uncultured Clostridium sp.]SCJ97068.1 Bacterial capsule synthesis protein PGA_cap [uncultured Clostridium sp.]